MNVEPGAIIKETIESLGFTHEEFADRSKLPISDLIEGIIRIDAEIAEKLELATGVPSRFWHNLEKQYQLKINRD